MIEKRSDSLPVFPDRGEVERATPRSVFWSQAEADTVVGFLNGDPGYEDDGGRSAPILAAEAMIKPEDKQRVESLIAAAKGGAAQVKEESDEVMATERSVYEWMAVEAAESVLSQIERSLRSVGMLSGVDYRRRAVMGKLRDKKTFGLETNMSGYKHKAKAPVKDAVGNYIRADKVEGGYLRHEEGGPRVLSAVLLPMFDDEKPMKWGRFVRGMAHEVAHEIRVWANASLWENKDWSERLPRRGNVAAYGPQVGSNLMGAESVGMLSGIIAEKMWGEKKPPTVDEVLPLVAAKVSKRLEGEKGLEGRYDEAVIALYDHLCQIRERGGGNRSALDFLALGICGYVTYEHLPELIRAGVVNQEVFVKSKIVIREIFELMCGHDKMNFVVKDVEIISKRG